MSQEQSKRAQLQRTLGDTGTVLPFVHRGDLERPYTGWWAKLADDGTEVHLGAHLVLAAARCVELARKTEAHA